MKTYLAIVLMISVPIIVLASEYCPECIENIDLTDKQSVISCAATIIIGLLIRAFERRRLKKQLKDEEKNEKN